MKNQTKQPSLTITKIEDTTSVWDEANDIEPLEYDEDGIACQD